MSQQDAPQTRGLAYKWRVLISVIFGVFMVILDTTVVNVAFQTLRRDFGASLSEAQWVLSIYVLALGISTPISGFMADRFGLKRTYLSGLSVFVFGSLLCGIAPESNLLFLIAARALQGIGGGIALPLGTAFLFRAFPPEEQGVALGMFGIALVMGPALGPVLGGFLVDQDLWRWIFFINVPIGVIGISLASRWLKRDKPETKPRLDVLGLVTSVVGFGAVLYASSIAAEQGWTAGPVTLWFIVGAVGLLAFGIIELFVVKDPLLDLRLFKNPTFLLASLIGWVSVLALFGAEFLLPLYLQILRGRSALETGFILLPLAITAGISMPLAGRLFDKVGPRPLIIVGFSVLLINTWQLSLLEADTSIQWILFLLALRGLALGLTVQTTFVTALSVVPLPKVARGSALVNSTRQVIQSIGVAILATILASAISPQVRELQATFQEAPVAAAEASQPFGLCETPGVAPEDNLPPGTAGLPPAAQSEIRGQIAQACSENVIGFERTYRFTFYVTIVALMLGLFLPGWPLKWAGRRSGDAQPVAAGH